MITIDLSKFLSADALSKFMTAILVAGGTLQFVDWVNLLAYVTPQNAGLVIAIYNAVKLVLNARTALSTPTPPAK